MDVETLSRIQFALTAGFHFLFPPISIGFAVFIVIIEALWLKTGDIKYQNAAKFFLKLFGMIFAVGVVTGIVMVFQFGTNWPIYSGFVGDVFGSPLAIEAVFAFFMESTFLGIALFGWNRIGKKAHFFATFMVMVGSHLSAIWIIAANSFMQTPDGFQLEYTDPATAQVIVLPEGTVPTAEQIPHTKARITNFWEMAINHSTLHRLTHTVAASWLAGAFLALGICGYYILKKRKDVPFAKQSAKVALIYAAVAGLAVTLTGHDSMKGLMNTQPEKMAAMEGHYETMSDAPLYLFGWVDEEEREVYGVKANGLFSLLASGSFSATITGLNELPSDEFLQKIQPGATEREMADMRPQYWAPINFVFQTFRGMVYLGGAMGLLIALGLLLWVTKKLFDTNLTLTRLFWLSTIPSVLLPLMASQVGWATAEVGRQPWIVWHILKTQDACTTTAHAGEILASILMFTAIFSLITLVFLYVFFKKIKKGPAIISESTNDAY